ncbi:MAG: type I methionyl aminopeptidase [Anaerolineaceae bacterium]|nr:type I methionyl aminopeptidase [Anaerolineaceae bacterium]
MSWDRKITVKTIEELAIMRMAGRINAEALDAAYKAIHPGATTADLNAAAEEILKKYGVYSPFKNYPGPYPYPASTNVSINNELVHGIPGKRRLKKGDIVSVDCGTVYEGFVGDSAFTAAVGEVDEETQKLLEITEQCLYAGISKMAPGNHVGDISSIIQTVAESNGFEVTREYTGHGVGRDMHQGPQVPNYGSTGKGLKLKAGIVMALEPMLLIETQFTKVQPDEWTVVSTNGKLTSHWEHTVAVTENGPMILTLLEDGSSPGQIAGRLEL